jgi:hypothetical protein
MHGYAVTMTRDCSTARIRSQDLFCLLDTMSDIERQMVTARMPRIRIDELMAIPEPSYPFEPPTKPVRRMADVTVICAICTFSMTICAVLACLA